LDRDGYNSETTPLKMLHQITSYPSRTDDKIKELDNEKTEYSEELSISSSTHNNVKIETEMKDPQLAAALRSITARTNNGEWLTLGDDSSLELMNLGELTEQLAFRDRLIEEIQNASTTINTLRNPDLDDSKGEFQIKSERISKGDIFELRDSNGNVIHRFSTEDPEALAAVLNAISTPEVQEMD